jgi:hypothetical protein
MKVIIDSPFTHIINVLFTNHIMLLISYNLKLPTTKGIFVYKGLVEWCVLVRLGNWYGITK